MADCNEHSYVVSGFYNMWGISWLGEELLASIESMLHGFRQELEICFGIVLQQLDGTAHDGGGGYPRAHVW